MYKYDYKINGHLCKITIANCV